MKKVLVSVALCLFGLWSTQNVLGQKVTYGKPVWVFLLIESLPMR